MPSMPRFLIITADERTWKFDRPVIFLGEWCRVYDRKHIWQGMDAIVAAPYGLGKEQKDLDDAQARALEEKVFSLLCGALNQYHGTQHSTRFWRIILGHWLKRYVDVILNRVRTLEQCMRSYQLSGTVSYSDECYALAPQDSLEAVWAFNDDRWNSVLCVKILKLLGKVSFPIEEIAGDASEGFRGATTSNPGFFRKLRILKSGYYFVRNLTGYLARENDAFIINSYLPKKVELKLQLALGQVPQLWPTPQFMVTKQPDRTLRQSLSDQYAGSTDGTLFGIMCSLLFQLLPVCYLEGFDELANKVQQLTWPTKPKFIFTSNNFQMDELFKLWTALKVESGFKYITGQHGNNYGTSRYMNPSVEEATADKFLTWGWTDGLPQQVPAFIFKTAGCKAGYYNPNGGLLLIELCLSYRIATYDVWEEFSAYFQDQQVFVANLASTQRNNLTIRLHAGYRQQRWGEERRWHEFDSGIRIDQGGEAIGKLMSQSRLIVHSYDSTGILETLAQNIPTLAFWQSDFDHLRETAKLNYQLLVDAGIVHLTPESVAAKVNEVWDDVEGWWMQSEVQEARKKFCDMYARVSLNPVSELKQILIEK